MERVLTIEIKFTRFFFIFSEIGYGQDFDIHSHGLVGCESEEFLFAIIRVGINAALYP
jgi:hypothetical protein